MLEEDPLMDLGLMNIMMPEMTVFKRPERSENKNDSVNFLSSP